MRRKFWQGVSARFKGAFGLRKRPYYSSVLPRIVGIRPAAACSRANVHRRDLARCQDADVKGV
jgi:hypothetical protein